MLSSQVPDARKAMQGRRGRASEPAVHAMLGSRGRLYDCADRSFSRYLCAVVVIVFVAAIVATIAASIAAAVAATSTAGTTLCSDCCFNAGAAGGGWSSAAAPGAGTATVTTCHYKNCYSALATATTTITNTITAIVTSTDTRNYQSCYFQSTISRPQVYLAGQEPHRDVKPRILRRLE